MGPPAPLHDAPMLRSIVGACLLVSTLAVAQPPLAAPGPDEEGDAPRATEADGADEAEGASHTTDADVGTPAEGTPTGEGGNPDAGADQEPTAAPVDAPPSAEEDLGDDEPLDVALEAALEGSLEEELRWTTLRETLLVHHRQHQQEAWALVGAGVLGLAGGLAMAIAGREDPQWLANGLTTLSFGAINLPLGLLQLDLRGRRRDALMRLGPPDSFDERVARDIDAQRGKRASYAVNGALDVVYMLVGALLVARAEAFAHPGTSRGAGWAMIHQGAVLLALDLVGVLRATRRLRRARALRGF